MRWSLCHATARLPFGWCKAYEEWRANCDNWKDVEYILTVDTCDMPNLDLPSAKDLGIKVVENTGPNTAAAAWNASARPSLGDFLITVADDHFPCPHWDTELASVVPNFKGQYAIEVKCGKSPEDDEWMRCMVHSYITRAYYERIGNFFCPEYVGWYADVDYSEMARSHGVVIDARHLTFPHRHWIGGSGVGHDEIYARQNNAFNNWKGLEILGRRRASGFAGENH